MNNVKKESPSEVRWDFGDLIDDEAKKELRKFYQGLESSKKCQRIIIGYTPERKD